MDYTKPVDVVRQMLVVGSAKAGLNIKDLLLRGFLSGASLGVATRRLR